MKRIALLILFQITVHAATIPVTSTDDSGAGTLRAALASAGDGDTIDATSLSGTILLTSGELLVSNSVSIIGPGPDALAVDGNASGRVFVIDFGVVVSITGLTITNGLASGDENVGGGIYNDHSTLTLSNCVVTGNSADAGGGIYNDGEFSDAATLNIIASTIAGNSGLFDRGGGVFSDGEASGNATVTVIDSTFAGNSCHDGSGGGIFTDGQDQGSSLVVVSGSTFAGNSSDFTGGGIFNQGEPNGHATLLVSRSTFSDNSAPFGGGAIFNDGLFDSNTVIRVANSTFSGNSGGSIFNDLGLVEIGNTILNAGAPGANLHNSAGGTITSHGYNLSSDSGAGVLTAAGDQINKPPHLGPLQNNGGPTFTRALLLGSPAIDAGRGDTIVELASDADQRGLPRPIDLAEVANAVGSDGSDIGAFESQSIPPGPCPDLTGEWFSLVQTCKTPASGLQCKVKGTLLVRNVGTADALTSFIRYYLSSDGVETNVFLKQVATGKVKLTKVKKKKLSAKLPMGVNGTSQFILAVIDADHTIPECDEANNTIPFGPLP